MLVNFLNWKMSQKLIIWVLGWFNSPLDRLPAAHDDHILFIGAFAIQHAECVKSVFGEVQVLLQEEYEPWCMKRNLVVSH